MRNRSLLSLRRLCAAPLFIALLSAVLLAGAREASCEMHGLGAAVASAPADSHAANHAVSIAGANESGHEEHGDGMAGCDCTCGSACTISAPLATPPAAVMVRVALDLPEPSRQIDSAPARAPTSEASRLLPFANGPPTALI